MLPSYFDYIFVHLRQKAHLKPELSPKFVVNFRPEPDPQSPARLTTFKPTANPIYLHDSSSHSASETSEEEVSPCSCKRIHASNQIVSMQLSRKILLSKTLTRVADREGLSTNHYFSVVASMTDPSSGSINCGFFPRFKNFQKLF